MVYISWKYGKPIDWLEELIGLDEVNKEFANVGKLRDSLYQKSSLKEQNLNAVFTGNPGTGKITVARIYSVFLKGLKIYDTKTWIYEETSGSRLASEGVQGFQKILDKIVQGGASVLSVDEGYQLVNGNNGNERAVLDFLMAEMENLRGKVVFIFAGYKKEVEKFIGHNPGIKHRIPLNSSLKISLMPRFWKYFCPY